MRLRKLRDDVVAANVELVSRNLVLYTFGNASGIDRESGLVAIKPSGVPFDELRAEHIVLADLDGKVVDSDLRPSSDLPTHIELYKAFPEIGGIVHTHSTHATSFAQAGREIPCIGTSHADYWYGPVPVTEPMPEEEIRGEYEKNTGTAIVRRFAALKAADLPGVLVHGHGPFAWGDSAAKAVFHAVILEELARMAFLTLTLNPEAAPLPQAHLDKHFLRKHGPGAYYGQEKR
jgi:L-ribulose-5-phosphate 4-epimerase